MRERFFQTCSKCKARAFEYKRRPYPGMILDWSTILTSDPGKAGDPITCQACGVYIYIWDLGHKSLEVVFEEA